MGCSDGSVETKRSMDSGDDAHKMDPIRTRVCMVWFLVSERRLGNGKCRKLHRFLVERECPPTFLTAIGTH